RAVYLVLKSFIVLLFSSTVLGISMYSGRFTGEWFQDLIREMPEWLGTLVYTLYMSRSDMMSFILNPDFYAAFLVMLMFLPLSMFLGETSVKWRVFGFITFLLSIVSLLFTNSNDSNIALLFSIPVYIALLAMNLNSLN